MIMMPFRIEIGLPTATHCANRDQQSSTDESCCRCRKCNAYCIVSEARTALSSLYDLVWWIFSTDQLVEYCCLCGADRSIGYWDDLGDISSLDECQCYTPAAKHSSSCRFWPFVYILFLSYTVSYRCV